jgi:hypothetical protein
MVRPGPVGVRAAAGDSARRGVIEDPVCQLGKVLGTKIAHFVRADFAWLLFLSA